MMRRNSSTIEFVEDGDYGIAPDATDIGEPDTNVTTGVLVGFTASSSDISRQRTRGGRRSLGMPLFSTVRVLW